MTARPKILVVLAISLVTLSLSAVAHAGTTLYARTGPGFDISLKNAAGKKVIHNPHNFRLRGPGLDRATSVPFAGKRIWTVTLRPGLYRFLCDPHELAMRGSFRVTK